MDKDQVLIVTCIDDPHADDVIVALERDGHEPIRLNTDDFPGNTMMSMSWGADDDALSGTIEVLTTLPRPGGRRVTARLGS